MNDKKIVIFSLGRKGYEAVRACSENKFKDYIELVVIGRDKMIKNDYAIETEELSRNSNIKFVYKEDYKGICNDASYVALASGWRWLIKENFFQIIVEHDSILPKYRGFNPLVTALLNRDLEIGATCILASDGYDEGDIICQRRARISYPITIEEAMDIEGDLIYHLIKDFLIIYRDSNEIVGKKQDERLASYSVWRDNEDYRIDWNRSSEDICHFINCLSYPYLGASTILDGEELRIMEATTVKDVSIINRTPGKVIFVENGEPVIICGQGLLKIMQLFDNNGNSRLPLKKFRSRFK